MAFNRSSHRQYVAIIVSSMGFLLAEGYPTFTFIRAKKLMDF
jgi:hypothetical protein